MFKNKNYLVILFVLLLSLPLVADSLTLAESSFTGFRLSRCLPRGGECLKVEALKAEGGHFGEIISLKNIKITWQNRESGKVQKIQESSKGYVDLASDQVVSIEKTRVLLKEHVIRLADFKSKTFVVKLL